MAFRNPFGSVSALSLSADPKALPEIAAVGGTVIVCAAVFAYKAYQHYEEKKHRKKIEEINRLHKKHLERIIIFENHEIRGFPIIYQMEQDKDSWSAKSLHYNDEEVEDIARYLPHGRDIELTTYKIAVRNAIKHLKKYYFAPKFDRNGVTAGVISYLLNMLHTKCLNFEGFDYDIAYLNALAHFTNEYASLKKVENSQRFSYLDPVYQYMLTAKQILQIHQESLSLEEIISEFRDNC